MNPILDEFYDLPIELLKLKSTELTMAINHLQDPQALPYLELLREIINERIELLSERNSPNHPQW